MAAALTLQEVLLKVGEIQQWQDLLAQGYLFPPLLHPLPWLQGPNLGSSAFASTDMAELAAAAAPGVMMLG